MRTCVFRVLGGLLLLTACGDSTMPRLTIAPDVLSPLQQERLQGHRIFFGHQSVGGNVMDGVVQLAAWGTSPSLTVERTLAVDSTRTGVLAHEWIGENGFPETKLAALDSVVRGPAASADVVLFKFCYTDYGPGMDPVVIFEAYQRQVRSLQALRPELTMVHVTTPVPEPEGILSLMMRKVRGRMTLRERIAKINRYNELLRTAYTGREPIFDLALLESQGPDASQATITVGGQVLGVLNPAWSEDGAHLNEAGRTSIARQLLVFLADSLPERGLGPT